MLTAVSAHLHEKSAAMLQVLESRLNRIIIGWLLVAGLAATARIAAGASRAPMDAEGLLPYLLLVFAPIASLLVGLWLFRDGERHPQPVLRLARFGRWRSIDRVEAMRHPLYGTSGIMVSLLVGILLNIPVRAAEYLAAIPAISGPVPGWLFVLHTMMTLDVVLLTSLYAVCFAAALRKVPLFPRLLAAVWLVDIVMQLLVAQFVAGTEGLPQGVASSLHDLLDGNIKKVLISVALWLPYLLLSTRVNVTFRNRIPG